MVKMCYFFGAKLSVLDACEGPGYTSVSILRVLEVYNEESRTIWLVSLLSTTNTLSTHIYVLYDFKNVFVLQRDI